MTLKWRPTDDLDAFGTADALAEFALPSFKEKDND